MTTSEPPAVACRVCEETEAEHDGKIHPFTRPGEELPRAMFARRRSEGEEGGIKLPFDPVLRQVLLDRGVVTPEELKAAEQKVLAVVRGAMGGVGRGDDRPC
jgi:hypothetical protein